MDSTNPFFIKGNIFTLEARILEVVGQRGKKISHVKVNHLSSHPRHLRTKEIGIFVRDCQVLGEDAGKIFDIYWSSQGIERLPEK